MENFNVVVGVVNNTHHTHKYGTAASAARVMWQSYLRYLGTYVGGNY